MRHQFGGIHVESLVNYPEPRTTKQVQRFLGLAGYFRKFIKDYAKIAKALSDLLKKDRPFKFGEEQHRAFVQLKKALVDAPVLQLYSQHRETELHTDASKDGYGAILLQNYPNDQLMHPVYYMSRKTTPAEQKYSSYELEFLAVVKALDKFRCYLLEISFKIVTDCAAFQQTMNKEGLTPRVGRWIMFVDEFDYAVEHHQGDRMKHADALSRVSSVYAIEDTLNGRIRRAQDRNDSIAAIKIALQHGNHKDYELRHGLVYKGTEGERRLAIPAGLQQELIKRAHEVGHFGTKKTVELLEREYYMPSMKRKVNKYVHNCLECILGSAMNGRGEGFLNPILKEDTPLHTIHLDHMGPLPLTKKEYKHLLIMVDAVTKYVWIFPTKSTSTEEVIKHVKMLQQHFGSPRRIITDRGTAFTSQKFDKFYVDNDIVHLLITAGVPRGNGQVERINSVITGVITKIGAEKSLKWYKYVSRTQQAINGTYQGPSNQGILDYWR